MLLRTLQSLVTMRADFIPGLSVELCSNGRALREFDDENTISGENLTTTRYVEAVPNAQFSAHLSFEPKFRYILDDLAVGICIDGQEMTSHCLPSRPDRHLRHHCIGESITNINGVGHRQVLTFGELKTSKHSADLFGHWLTINVAQLMGHRRDLEVRG